MEETNARKELTSKVFFAKSRSKRTNSEVNSFRDLGKTCANLTSKVNSLVRYIALETTERINFGVNSFLAAVWSSNRNKVLTLEIKLINPNLQSLPRSIGSRARVQETNPPAKYS